MWVAAPAVLLGAVLLYFTMDVLAENQSRFLVMISLTALFIPFAASNVISTVYDVTLPEVRSTALAVQYFIEPAGAATAPLLAGLIAVRSSLHNAILIVCKGGWVLCAIVLAGVAYLVPRDIEALQEAMRQRAEMERGAS